MPFRADPLNRYSKREQKTGGDRKPRAVGSIRCYPSLLSVAVMTPPETKGQARKFY